MTTAIVLFSYFSGIEVPIDWVVILEAAREFLITVAAVLVVLA